MIDPTHPDPQPWHDTRRPVWPLWLSAVVFSWLAAVGAWTVGGWVIAWVARAAA